MRPGTNFGLRSHLALVQARISGLDIFDLQRPQSRAVNVERLIPVVCNERQSVHGEDVVVSHSDPGHGFVGQLSRLVGKNRGSSE